VAWEISLGRDGSIRAHQETVIVAVSGGKTKSRWGLHPGTLEHLSEEQDLQLSGEGSSKKKKGRPPSNR